MDDGTAHQPRESTVERQILTALSFERVTLRLGARTVLSDVDLTIGSGQFIGLLGPNGAGKTTLLRAVLGLVQPLDGSIQVLGQPVRRGNRLVGYMPQHRTLAAGHALTGWDYVASAAGGWRWGLPRLSAAERNEVEWALDTVAATDLARPAARQPVGRRAPATADLPGPARPPQASAARRAIDQPRSQPSAKRRRPRQATASRVRHDGRVQRP